MLHFLGLWPQRKCSHRMLVDCFPVSISRNSKPNSDSPFIIRKALEQSAICLCFRRQSFPGFSQTTIQVYAFFSGWTESRFEQTPRMSTYLFALAISDFPFKETRFKSYKAKKILQVSLIIIITNILDSCLDPTLQDTACRLRSSCSCQITRIF